MKPVFKNYYLPVLALLISSVVQAGALRVDEMTSSQLSRAQNFAQTVIRQDLAQNTLARMYEAATSTDEAPMTPETRRLLAKGAYMLVSTNLASQGIYISEHQFTQKIETLLNGMAAYGLFPHAFTVGYMARTQFGAGGSLGTQFNFYFDQGQLKMSSYSMFGLQAGIAAQSKVQFYVALCFGSCFGGDPNGWYVGTDVSATLGAGVDGFLEFGIDFTDLFKASYSDAYSLKDMWESKAVYAGAGFDVGFGAGWSVDLFHYRQDFEKILSQKGLKPSQINPRAMTQYQLRQPAKK